MRYPLLFLFLLCATLAFAQPNQLFSEAEKLSAAGQYSASNALLDKFVAAYPTRMYDKGEAFFLKSYNHLLLGNLEAALSDNATSLELRRQFIPEDAAKNYMRFGAIYQMQGQYEQALDYLFQSEEFPLIDDPHTAALIKGYIGNVYADLKQYVQARKYYRQSLDILLIEEGEESPDVVSNYYHIGRTFLMEDKPGMAREWFEKALATEQAPPGAAIQKGRLYNAMGQVEMEAGELDKAEVYYQKAVQVFEAPLSNNPKERARSLINLAELKLKQKDHGGARLAIQDALRQLCPDFAGGRFEDNPDADALVLSRPLLARALEIKSVLLWHAFEGTGKQEALEQALSATLRGIAAIEEEVAFLGGETSRLLLLEEHAGIYEMGITAAFLLYERSGSLAYAERAFELSERAKALLQRLNRISRQAFVKLPPELQEEEARRRYAMKAAEVAFTIYPDSLALQQELAHRRQAYRELMGQMRASAPDYYRQRFAESLSQPQQLQGQLGEKQVLLSYFLGADHYFIFALTADNFRIFRLGNEMMLTEAPGNEWRSLTGKTS